MEDGKKSLLGVCGTYCGSCPILIAYKKGIDYQKKLSASLSAQMDKKLTVNDIQCQGCRDAAKDKDSWSFKCKIRKCAADKNAQTCSDCSEFPCEKFTAMSYLYDGLLFRQLEEYKELGIDKWLELMQTRWKCPKCTGAIESATKKCGTCNIDRSKHVDETFKKKQQ